MAVIDIEVGCADGIIDPVRVRACTPTPARALAGLTPAAVVGVLGRLYAVCGAAQRACAELALAAAAGGTLAPEREERLARGLAAEAIQEHLWRLWLDWPAALGQPPARAQFTHYYARIQSGAPDWPAELAATLAAEWLGVGPARCAEFGNLDAFDAWHAAGASPAARLFAALSTEPAAAPVGAATSPPGVPAHAWVQALHVAHRSLEAQLATRIVALDALVSALADDRPPDVTLAARVTGTGRARAAVTTARGTLEHDVHLERGHVVAYEIHTPTDRHFAPDGDYVACVRRRPAVDAAAARRTASLWALALDPCVTYAVKMPEADHA